MDPVDFVRGLAPFRDVPATELSRAVAGLEIVYRPAGDVLLRRGGQPSEHLWILRSGRVELRASGDAPLELEPGDWFGFPSLLEARPPGSDAVVVEDALIYRLPGAALRPLLAHPTVAAHVTGGLAARLRAAEPAVAARALEDGAAAAELVVRPPVVLAEGTTVRAAAGRMRDEGISSVVVDRRPWAVVTERDLRDVVAAGLPPDTPLREVASSAACASRDATVGDVLEVLLDRATHHVVLTADGTGDGTLHGVVTTGDLLRRHADSPVHVARAVRGARTPEDLVGTRARTISLARALHTAGVDPLVVLRAVSAVSDAATVAALRIAAGESSVAPAREPPPTWAWLAVGSQARREQGLLTDQDHALVHDRAGPEWTNRIAAMTERVVELLEVAGMPRCPGDAMATRWTGDVDRWRDRVAGWARRPDARALLHAAIAFDHRAVAGSLDLGPLEAVFAAAGQDDVFVARLAGAAGTVRPRGRHRRSAVLDVKADGLGPIVDVARVLALRAGAAGTPGTVDRLAAAHDAGLVSEDGRATLVESFRFLQRLRLQHHLDAAADGRELDNRVDPAHLDRLDRRHLVEVHGEVRRLHRQLLAESGAREAPV